MFHKKIIIFSTLLLAACVNKTILPLSENSVRINAQAGGLLFKGQAVPTTMRTAAEATLERGYSHFRLMDASLKQGSQYVGTISDGQATCSGDGYYAQCYGSGSGFAINRPVETSEVTVIMYHAHEAAAKGAFDARKILAQYSQDQQ